jgi:hypothetical protein
MKKMRQRSSENIGGLQDGRSPLEEVATLSEVAAYLKMTPSQVRELCRRRCAHPLPVLKAGRHLRFSLHSVADWLMQKK